MTKTRSRQPLILVTAIVVAFALAFAAGQLFGGSSAPNSSTPTGKASQVDVSAPAIGSAGAAQSLPGLKQTERTKGNDNKTASTNNAQSGDTASQNNTTAPQNDNTTAPQNNNTTPPANNNTTPPANNNTKPPAKTKPPVIIQEEGGGTE